MSNSVTLPSTVKETRQLIKDAQKHIKRLQTVESSNHKFRKLSAPEKRIAIARDVIAAVQAKKFVPTQGTYFHTNLPTGSLGKELQPIVADQSGAACTVCALGACFTSKIRLSNKFKIPSEDELSYAANGLESDKLSEANSLINDRVHENLNSLYSPNQRSLIETAFETSLMIAADSTYTDGDEEMYDARRFGRAYYYPNERLVAIMQNIIDNYGYFIPNPDNVKRIGGYKATKAKYEKTATEAAKKTKSKVKS